MEEKMLRKKRSLITLTDAAAVRVKDLLDKKEAGSCGIRIGVRESGCSGLSYTFDYVVKGEENPKDEVTQDRGVSIFIDPRAVLYLVGTEMDYQETKVRSGFVFTNPNAKGQCGCGTSFSV